MQRSSPDCSAGADDGVDLVDEEYRIGLLLELGENRLEPLLEVAAVAGAGQQRAHVERVDGRLLQYVRHFAVDDLAREPLGDGRLADTGFTDIERVVLGAAAQDLDRALDLVLAADQRIDLALAGFLVEVDAIGRQRLVALLGRRLSAVLLLGSGGAARASAARHLGLAVADIVHRVQPRHALVLEKRHRVAVPLRKERDQHIGAGHFLTARRLDVHGGALNDALEARGRQWLVRRLGDDAFQAIVDEGFEVVAQPIDVDAAGLEDGRCVFIFGHRQEQMLQGRVFVTAFPGERERSVQGLLEVLGQHGHRTTLD